MKKVVLKRIVKYMLNGLRKMVAVVIKNKNLEVDSYLYDMSLILRRDLSITRCDTQYVLHVGSSSICTLNENKAIHVIDMTRFQKIKTGLMKIGGTPKKAYQNLDLLFESKTRHGSKPVSVTIHR